MFENFLKLPVGTKCAIWTHFGAKLHNLHKLHNLSQNPLYGFFSNFAAKLRIKKGSNWHVCYFPENVVFTCLSLNFGQNKAIFS